MKQWTIIEIRQLLMANSGAVERAVVAIYKRQTGQERDTHSSSVKNGVGFNSHDAPYFSELAKTLLGGHHILPRELGYSRQAMLKYAKQLRDIANGRLAELDC